MKKLGRLKKAIKKQQSYNTADKINAMLKKEARGNPNYKAKPGHRLSKLADPCLRMNYYSYFRVPQDSPATVRLMKYRYSGIFYEEMVMTWLKAIGEFIPYRNKGDGEIPKDWKDPTKENPQFRVKSKKWRIRSGFIDNVAKKDDGKLWIYEIKTCGTKVFDELKQPKPEHFTQGVGYLQLFNDLYLAGEFDHIPEIDAKAVGVIFIYVNRDNADFRQFVYTLDQVTQLILDIDKKVENLNSEYIDELKLPPKTPKNCYFCDYKMKCDNDWNSIDIPEE